MPPKSERFEMRLDEEILARIERWRGKQDDVPSRAEAIRRLIELGLMKSVDYSVKFSDGEKLLTAMMRDLYKHLKLKGGEIDPDFMMEVICGGHYWAPKWEMQGLYHDHEDNPQDVRFVVDVLDMWTFIERAYSALSKKDKERVEKEAITVTFPGFDGNHETSHMSIARFLIDQMKRFSQFKNRELNSHSTSIGRYSRMLSVFEPMRAKLVGMELSADQLIEILSPKKAPH